MKVRSSLALVLLLTVLFIPLFADAARLPQVTITADEWAAPAETTFLRLREQRIRTRHPAYVFWKSVVDLKTALLALPPAIQNEWIDAEADHLAKTVIATIYRLSHDYRILISPRIHNTAIKLGLRQKGYCYHYANDLRQALAERTWSSFSWTWVEGYAGTRRESNAIALFRTGQSFETGIIIDPWRTGSKPYWRAVKGDRWPWQEWNGVLATD